jgi:hypothetical protein
MTEVIEWTIIAFPTMLSGAAALLTYPNSFQTSTLDFWKTASFAVSRFG